MKKNAYWVISRDVETTELKFSKLFPRRFEAREYFPYFKSTRGPWENVTITLETLPVGELPKVTLS
jgi:hypothetical protein